MISFSSFGAGWIFIAIVVIIIFAVIAIVQKRQSMATSAVKIFAIFLVVSVGYIFIVNKINLTSLNSVIDGMKIYFNWMLSIFDRTIDITSYAIKQNWTVNSTI
jgi:glucan phosphoethanolaminetransferase (alkaline phosphatase superfamily)